MTPKYVFGGIGDILLSLEDAIKEGVISVYSHFKNAPDMFAPFNIRIERFEYIKDMNEYHKTFINGEALKRYNYPKFQVPEPPFKRPKGKIIGIHVEGSNFSNDFWKSQSKPTKNMTDKFLSNLLLEVQKYKLIPYVFCSPERSDEIKNIVKQSINKDFHIIAFENIWDSLSCVQHCNYVIGMDSCIKTMSAILQIRTITLIGNYKDNFRDATFITPYVNDGVMRAILFDDIDLVPVNELFVLINP